MVVWRVGETFAKLRLYGSIGKAELEALADTGATFTKLPRSLALRLGIKPKRKVSVQLATGKFISREMGSIEAELDDVRDTIPVTIGEEDELSLIGYTALEILGYKVNPLTQKLEPTHPVEY